MNEKQTGEHTEQEETTTKSYSLDEQTDQMLDQDADTEDTGSQKHGVLIIAVIVLFIIGFFIFQAFSGGMTDGSDPAVVGAEEPRVYEYVKTETHEVVGEHLVDMSSGRTLYIINEAECPVQCMTQWIPYAGVENLNYSSVTSEFDEAQGQYHYAWKGDKLYYYAQDDLPGDFLGDGFFFVGSIARP